MAVELGWKFCFQQELQSETLLYFQCDDITGELE